MAALREIKSYKVAGGLQKVFTHFSDTCKCWMNFAMFIPPRAVEHFQNKTTPDHRFPVLYWLSGRGCNERDFLLIESIQENAAKHDLVIVGPDTSPRDVMADEEDNFLIGAGASYYVDCTSPKWRPNYQMFSYVTEDIVDTVEKNFSFVDQTKRSIFGHSMGGHGSLLAVLKKPGRYASVSAFAPVANITDTDRGQWLYGQYFGPDSATWSQWDPTELVKKYVGPELDVLVDQGTDDDLLNFLRPWVFAESAPKGKVNVNLKMRDHYDHGSILDDAFIKQHIDHHAKYLKP